MCRIPSLFIRNIWKISLIDTIYRLICLRTIFLILKKHSFAT
nr:MAG TPA: hypothetical protein [Caudoviricetes sp.]